MECAVQRVESPGQKMMLSPLAVFFVTYTICGTGVFTNLLLVYTILKKTPEPLKSFSILLLNEALTDCAQCFAEIFVVIRASPMGRCLIVIPQGVCNYFGEQACVAGFSLSMALYCNIFFANTACFVFRYYVIRRGSVTVKEATVASVVLLLPAVCVFIACEYAVNTSSAEVIAHLSRDLLGTSGFFIFGVDDILKVAPQIYLFLSIFSSPIHYAVMIYMRRKVLHLLDSNEHISATTKKGHMQLMKAITLQACIPPLVIVDIALYGLMQSGVIQCQFLEQLLCLWGASGCTVAPVIHLYFIRPYREAVLSMFGYKPLRSNTVTYTNNQTSVGDQKEKSDP